jgi:hypothetical protein
MPMQERTFPTNNDTMSIPRLPILSDMLPKIGVRKAAIPMPMKNVDPAKLGILPQEME